MHEHHHMILHIAFVSAVFAALAVASNRSSTNAEHLTPLRPIAFQPVPAPVVHPIFKVGR